MHNALAQAVRAAGISELVLVAASLAIPGALRWREETARLRRLTRQVFWTYAAYIWCTNLAFGLLSTIAPFALLDGSFLARSVSCFICLYWAVRFVLQVGIFDRRDIPPGLIWKAGDVCLTSLFGALAIVYGTAALTGTAGWPG